MPITVKHGEGLEGLAALVAAMAGAGQQGVPQAPGTGGNFISYSVPGGGGGGGGGRSRGGARRQGQVAPPGEPTEEEQLRIEMQMRLKEKQFGIPIEEERMQMEQEMKANGWKLEYTAESRKRIAKANDGLRIVEERERAGLISPAEAEAMRQALNQELVGTPEAWMPPDPNTPIFEPGKGIGDQWTDEEGNRVTRNEKGVTQVQVSFDKTQAGLQMKYEATLEQKELEVRTKRQDAWLVAKQKLLQETVMEKVVGGEDGEEIEVPKYTPRGAKAFLERVGYTDPFEPEVQEQQGPTDADLEQELQRRVDEKTWWTAAEGQGMKITEEMRQAPPEIGQAMLYIQEAEGKYRNAAEIPANVLRQLVEADRRIKSYESGGP